MAVRVGVWLVLGTLASTGCTTVLYSGPRRPREQVAMISASDTLITAVDGVPISQSLGKLELLPGPHSISMRVSAARTGFMHTTHIYSNGSLTVCFVAKPGREYLTRPSTDDDQTWVPMIIDTGLAYAVKVIEVETPHVDCGERLPAESAGRAAQQGVAADGAPPRR
jgi:hypothetical protein